MSRLLPILIVVVLVLGTACGCAAIGDQYPDVGATVKPATTGGNTTGTPPTTGGEPRDVVQAAPDEGGDGEPDLPADLGLPPQPDEGPVDPDADWECEDDGFIDEGFGQCDWTWECNAGDFTITCTEVAALGTLECQCRKGGAIVQDFPADEYCNALSTVNAANAYCKWQLPLD